MVVKVQVNVIVYVNRVIKESGIDVVVFVMRQIEVVIEIVKNLVNKVYILIDVFKNFGIFIGVFELIRINDNINF